MIICTKALTKLPRPGEMGLIPYIGEPQNSTNILDILNPYYE